MFDSVLEDPCAVFSLEQLHEDNDPHQHLCYIIKVKVLRKRKYPTLQLSDFKI